MQIDPVPAQLKGLILVTLEAVESYIAAQAGADAPSEAVAMSLATARQVQTQDVTTGQQGQPVLRQRVAKERRISVEDSQIRHRRRSERWLLDGHKRHVLCDLDSGLERAVGLR